jgi:hypothetical protein
MLASYRRMLEFADGGQGGVTRNAAEKKLNSLLDAVAAQAAQQQAQQQQQQAKQQQSQQGGDGAGAGVGAGAADGAAGGGGGGGDGAAAAAGAATATTAPRKESAADELLRAFYEQTVASLDRGRNERLWFKASMRLAHLALERADYAAAAQLLRALHRACRLDGGGAEGGGAGAGAIDPNRGTQALEVYAAEIRMATEQRDNKRLKELYHQVSGDEDGGPPTIRRFAAPQRATAPAKHGRSLDAPPPLPALSNNPPPKTPPKPPKTPPNKTGPLRQVGHPPPARPGRHPRVRRQDAHGRAPVGARAL